MCVLCNIRHRLVVVLRASPRMLYIFSCCSFRMCAALRDVKFAQIKSTTLFSWRNLHHLFACTRQWRQRHVGEKGDEYTHSSQDFIVGHCWNDFRE